MDRELLREIGLSEGEIDVYKALIVLGKSSTGPIVKESGVSTSKVYPILDRLINKGMASYIVENNTKKYSPTNPENIVDYVEKKENKWHEIKEQSKDMAERLKEEIGSFEKETAQLYKGFSSVRAAFQNLLDGLKGTDKDFLFFVVPKDTYTDRVKFFMDRFNQKRAKSGVKARGISPLKFKDEFGDLHKERDLYELRFVELGLLPYAINIGNNRTLMTAWDDENPIGVEHVSSRLTKRHRGFFNTLWENAEK